MNRYKTKHIFPFNALYVLCKINQYHLTISLSFYMNDQYLQRHVCLNNYILLFLIGLKRRIVTTCLIVILAIIQESSSVLRRIKKFFENY